MSRGGGDPNSDPSAKVYVGDLGDGGNKGDLEKEFEKFGPLKSVWVARNPPGGRWVLA
jgi:RNA recognition motif-containing protein